ncbi:hypothetical protein ID866_12988, partial [Astraeus odoratus]
MLSCASLGKYLRDFEHISLFLVHKDRLSSIEQNCFFLEGFHPQFRADLLSRLSLVDLNHYPDDPWATDKVLAQAKYIL